MSIATTARTNAAYVKDQRVVRTYDEICDKLKIHANFRHRIIHGYVIKYDPGGFEAHFARYHRTELFGEIEYHFDIEEVLGEVMEVQDLASYLFRLTELLAEAERERE